MSYKNLEQQQQALEAAKFENAKHLVRLQVYAKWPETIVPCDANDKRIIDIIDRWTGNDPSVLPTLAIFEQAIYENPEEFQSLAHQSEDVTRRQLTDSIIEILRAKGKGHDEFTLKSERTRLKAFSIMALRERLETLQRSARMATIPVATLKSMVAEAHATPGYPILPRQMFENGQTVDVNANYIRHLDSYSLKRMCRIYSSDAVNQRLVEG
jgi:hypothetical protein